MLLVVRYDLCGTGRHLAGDLGAERQQIDMSTDRHAACGKIYDDLCGAGRHLTSELGVERQQIDVSTKTYF